MKYRLDFSGFVTKLNGTEFKDQTGKSQTWGTGFASILENQADTGKNARKLATIAKDLYDTGIVDLDIADFEMLKKYVEDDTTKMFVFFKDGLLEVFANAMELA